MWEHLQWPAMATSLIASVLMTSSESKRRNIAFWLFLVSNVAWVGWGIHVKARALIAMQVGLIAINVVGMVKTKLEAE